MKKRKRSVIKEERSNFSYRESWNYIKESRKYIYTIVALFFGFALIGLIFPVPELINTKLLEIIKGIVDKTQGMSGLRLIGFIFLNNSQASLFGIVLGMLLGIFPLFASIFNGYLLGYVSKFVIAEGNFLSLWRLLPHGIFELPAVFISFGLGLRQGLFFFEKKNKGFKYYFYNAIKVFLLIIIPLLVVAAIIEGGLITLGN